MKLAITAWEDRVSPLCDAARSLLIVSFENRQMVKEGFVSFEAGTPLLQASMLADLGVDVLICGAITESLSMLIERYTIQVIPFVSGRVDHILDAFSKGTLRQKDFRMPGCGSGRQRNFRRQLGRRHGRSGNIFNL
ncbi:dinitrogenase iron-molybdenum cofactor biosynthesis domain-containing protein [bacterium]|nr:dinitrogenase iron-molybdenum cofactor biosynthesis domain-containing protein [bacterium]